MPNWSQNRINIIGEPADIDRLIAECVTDDVLDFDKIVPKPEGFDGGLPSGTGDESYDFVVLGVTERYGRTREFYEHQFLESRRHYLAKKEAGEEIPAYLATAHFAKYETYEELGRAYARNLELTGYKTWYDWNVSNWGTKWPACEGSMERVDPYTLKFEFQTAWGPAEEVYAALSEKYPNLKIGVWADDEGSDAVWQYVLHGGEKRGPNL